MKRFDLKQLLLCIATLVSSQFELAGVYPLIPAIFMTGFLSGVNRSLLFLCTMEADHSGTGDGAGQIRSDRAVEYGADPWCGMVQRTLQDGSGSDPHRQGSLWAVGIGWSSMKLPGTSAVFIRICEGILVCGFIYVVTKLLSLIPEWEHVQQENCRCTSQADSG